MRKMVKAEQWRPVGGITLDDAALAAVRSTNNAVVIAGPGAGKTELLAQRACYLLQTGNCPSPRRVLAISFKRDAASNLRERVESRCGKEAVHRLDSMTYDAFAKSLLDRFLPALPADWQPDADYEIVSDTRAAFTDTINRLNVPAKFGTAGIGKQEIDCVVQDHGRHSLPLKAEDQTETTGWLAAAVWGKLLRETSPSKLTFPMICRLAELLLRESPHVLRALRATYSHVFLDEFQDTTYWQYSLVHCAFQGTPTIVTAVGDTKQRIMGWAGALPNAFEEFERDFGAKRHDLVINYRSAPRLVEIQQVLAERIDPKSVAVKSGVLGDDTGICEILVFTDYHQEAQHLAAMIETWVTTEGLDPRQLCVLAKQRIAQYGQELIRELGQRGIKARDEGLYQDILAEPAIITASAFIELAARGRAPDAWSHVTHVLYDVRGYSSDTPYEKTSKLEADLTAFITELHRTLTSGLETKNDLRVALAAAIDYIGAAPFRQIFPQYLQGNHFDEVLTNAATLLWDAFQQCTDWATALDTFRGVMTVPVMTVHKSKGLEYERVVFVGLESSAFWSFTAQPDADTNAFFVALSRAKRRLYFTFSRTRNTGRYGQEEQQSRTKIRPLYDLLEEAGVPIHDLTGGA